MKTKTYLYLAALTAGALVWPGIKAAAGSEECTCPVVVASPRAQEAFPWLASTRVIEPCCVEDDVVVSKRNCAQAASPRMIEQYPELCRVPVAQPEFTVAPLVPDNDAVGSSPQTREEYTCVCPCPCPETGSARGGATKLMYWNR